MYVLPVRKIRSTLIYTPNSVRETALKQTIH